MTQVDGDGPAQWRGNGFTVFSQKRLQSNVLRFDHEQWLSLDGLRSLAFSRSYIPARDAIEGAYVWEMIDRIYEAHAHEGKVRVPYRTVAMVGRPQL